VNFKLRGSVDSEAVDTDSDGLTETLGRYDKVMRMLVWLLGGVLAAALIAFAWLVLEAHALDADMDMVAASRGGG
jgi:hypothetical protein